MNPASGSLRLLMFLALQKRDAPQKLMGMPFKKATSLHKEPIKPF